MSEEVKLLPCPFCGGKAGYTPPFKVGTPSGTGRQLIEPARAFCLSEKCIRIANMPPEQWNTRARTFPTEADAAHIETALSLFRQLVTVNDNSLRTLDALACNN